MEEIQPVSGCDATCDNETADSRTFDVQSQVMSPENVQVLPESGVVPQSDVVPQRDVVPQNDVVPQSDVVPASVTESSQSTPRSFIEGTFEMEILTDGAEGEGLWRRCKKNVGHTNFIPVSDFTIQHLPEPYRSKELMDNIDAISKVTVRLTVKYTSSNRPDDDHFSKHRGQRVPRVGSGIVFPSNQMYLGFSAHISNLWTGNPVEDTCQCSDTEVAGGSYNMTALKDHFKSCYVQWGGDPNNVDARFEEYEHLFHSKILPATMDYIRNNRNPSLALVNQKMIEISWRVMRGTDMNTDIRSLVTSLSKYLTHDDKAADVMTEGTDNESELLCQETATNDKREKNLVREEHPCPCSDCKNSSSPQPTGYIFCLHTAKHVIFDDEEARSTIVDLFYDDKSGAGVEHLYGFRMLASCGGFDECVIECITHNDSLASRLRQLEQKALGITGLSDNGKQPLVVICSHPHGWFKHITVGEWTTRWMYPNIPYFPVVSTRYEYTTPTCTGSSGAPVFIFGQKENTRTFFSSLHYHYGYLHSNINYSGFGDDHVVQ